MLITEISQAKLNPNRVNLYLDHSFWIGITKDELIDFKIFKGFEIDIETKIQIERSSIESKTIEKIKKLILLRPRSKKEIEIYLKKKNLYDKSIIKKCEDLKIISDEYFADWYVSQSLQSIKKGKILIQTKLIEKGVSKNIIDLILKKYSSNFSPESEFEKGFKYAEKISSRINSKDLKKKKERLLRRLISKGYNYKTSIKIVNSL